ncbi:MAG: helix-turn-helix domain-containing protein [Gorillibacterium sp.]|nr:helix-turn-helix domain-containing protein [Gorillibacterium sp.]
MNWVEKIQEAIEYIETNLIEDITVESIGEIIHYAPSSFQNLFSAITGYSVMEYVRFRRLSCAADDLASSKLTVTDIAFKYGYETVEAFSKAFKRLFGCSPSRFAASHSEYSRFTPISINFSLGGGFCMRRNLIPDLLKVDWSDTQRQNEFVNSVVSALNAVGENLDYDYVCAVSGSAFRTSFSMPSISEWNHGNYHVIHTPIIIEHTFKMLGYRVTHHIRGDYDTDKKLVMDSIDKGMPVITLEGVIDCADACVISGYDNDGNVVLGYNPFMYSEEDHKEATDDTGYFRKSNWHDGFFSKGSKGRILIIEGKGEKLSKAKIFSETLTVIKRLVMEENLALGQYNGLAAHRALANALLTYTWDDNFEPYLNVMCNYKQYLDRQYAVPFLRANGRHDLAHCYERITELADVLGQLIPQDFSAGDKFNDRDKLKPYCDILLEICDLEEKAAKRID